MPVLEVTAGLGAFDPASCVKVGEELTPVQDVLLAAAV